MASRRIPLGILKYCDKETGKPVMSCFHVVLGSRPGFGCPFPWLIVEDGKIVGEAFKSQGNSGTPDVTSGVGDEAQALILLRNIFVDYTLLGCISCRAL